MQIRVKDDVLEIEGYVNAVERLSKPLRSRTGMFQERIKKGAFKRAIESNDDIKLMLNHRRTLGSTAEGNLELTEDNIGLKARAIVTDADVVEKGRNGDLVGWSFGFEDKDVSKHEENGMQTRDVKDMYLKEVSILDRTRTPAYDGTLINVRSEDEYENYGEEFLEDATIEFESVEETREETVEEEKVVIDYSKYEEMISEMKGEKHERTC